MEDTHERATRVDLVCEGWRRGGLTEQEEAGDVQAECAGCGSRSPGCAGLWEGRSVRLAREERAGRFSPQPHSAVSVFPL